MHGAVTCDGWLRGMRACVQDDELLLKFRDLMGVMVVLCRVLGRVNGSELGSTRIIQTKALA